MIVNLDGFTAVIEKGKVTASDPRYQPLIDIAVMTYRPTQMGMDNHYLDLADYLSKSLNRPVEEKGGPGSGNFAHSGRPGIQGGSSPQGVSMAKKREISPELRAKIEDEQGNPVPENQIGYVQGFLEKQGGLNVLPIIRKIVVCTSHYNFEMANAKIEVKGLIERGDLSEFEPEKIARVTERIRGQNWDTGAFVNGKKQTIYLRPMKSARECEVSSTDWMGNPTHYTFNPYDAFTHEVGHIFYFNDENYRAKWNEGYNNRLNFDRLTDYSKTKASEGNAETYKLLIRASERLKKKVTLISPLDDLKGNHGASFQVVINGLNHYDYEHPSNKGGPGSGNFGHAGRVGIQGGSAQSGTAGAIGNLNDVFDRRLKVAADAVQYPAEKIKYGGTPYQFEVGGDNYTVGGDYNPKTGDITIYDGALKGDMDSYISLLAHEVWHSKFHELKEEYEKQSSDIMAKIGKELAEGKSGKDLFMKASGEFRNEEDRRKYAIYNLFQHVYSQENWQKYKQLGLDKPVSDYAGSYWKKFDKTGLTDDAFRAYDETLAEVTRLKSMSRFNPDLLKYRNYEPEWKDLSEFFDSAYRNDARLGTQ